MEQSVRTYFETTIIPAITEAYPALTEEMSIIVLGSQGLGTADHLSDLEAAVYLEDARWREQGGQLQLLLNKCLQTTCPYRLAGSVIAVWPHSWLLGGHATEFLHGKQPLPWEEVSVEELFTLHENLISWDPKGFLAGMRQATLPSRYPLWLWKKRLLLTLKTLLEDYGDFTLTVKRSHYAEASILLGELVRTLFQIGFLINRRYYPWRKHLSWAFERLPQPTSALLTPLDRVVGSSSWEEKVVALNQIISAYRDYISQHGILPEINLLSSELNEELTWAERLKAWETPNWRDWIKRCQEKALRDGYPPQEFWVWSLWQWK